MIALNVITSYEVSKTDKFRIDVRKARTDLTADMLLTKSWKTETFKPHNFNALGPINPGGHLHPLLKVRQEIRQILLLMGFEEMPTNNFVESSFWNFDVLSQPQQHPARDAHDTFFMKDPESPKLPPPDYMQRVK